MKRRMIGLLLIMSILASIIPAAADQPVSIDQMIQEIDKEAKAMTVSPVTFETSPDGKSIFIDRPTVTGSDDYTIAYNIYDESGHAVNYFYSKAERVAATPGYGGYFNVFVVVTDVPSGKQDIQDIGWHSLSWPIADRLTVGRVTFTVSPDRKSVFVDRPELACRSGSLTIAYNIYDSNGNPVNYFYSNESRVAATPGYDGKFNIFIVVTDTVTGEQDIQDIGWIWLGSNAPEEPTENPDGRIGFNGHQYQLFSSELLTWPQAKAACEKLGGHLLTVGSAGEQAFITDYLTKSGTANAYYWIGLAETEDGWVWITGEKYSYGNWGTGEPDTDISTSNCNRGAIATGHFTGGSNVIDFGQWDAWKNADTQKWYYICEWGLDEQQPETEPVVILTQPADQTAAVGDKVSVTVEATGVKAYLWQYSYDKGASWKDCSTGGYNTNKYTYTVQEKHYDRVMRCRLTQSDGSYVYTDIAKLNRPSGTETNPPATNPPATNPPATNPPATNPPATNPPVTQLAVPRSFQNTGTTATTISLSWKAVSGAESYEIRYDKKGAIGWSNTLKVTGTSVTIQNLTPNTAYAFDICAVAGNVRSDRSDTIYAATQNLEVPANFKCTGTTVSSVSLSWSEVSGADSYEIRYDKKGTVGWSYSKKVTGTSVKITGLIPNQAYAFDICAVAGEAKSDRSSTIYATTKKLGVPTSFQSTGTTVNSVSLSWKAVSGAESYEIRYDKKGAVGWSYSKKVTGTSVTITGLDPNQTYAFDICSVLGSSKSDRSDTIYAATQNLEVPANFKSTGTTVSSVSLSWSEVSGADSYEIRYDKKGTVGWSYSKKVTGTSVKITGLIPNQAYAFDICAVAGDAKSDRSSTIYATTKKLGVPTSFQSTGTTVTTVSLSWKAVSGAESYEIRYDKKGAIGWSYSKKVTGTSVTITGLDPNQTYAFDICSVLGSSKSDRSDTIYAATQNLEVPANFKSTGTTVSSVSLSWSEVSGADSYEIRYDKKGTVGWSYSKKVTGTSVKITGLIPNQAYAFDICAVAGEAKSDRSSTIYATTKKLGVPANFKSTATTVNSVSLSWSAVSGAESYEIRYDKKGAIGWSYSKKVTGTSVTITGLTPNQAYAFDICAVLGSSKSDRSDTIYATTKNLEVPANFKSTGTALTTVSLSWSAVSGADSYEIRYDKKGAAGWSYTKKVTGTSVTITGLIPNQAYAFDICAVAGDAKSGRSSTIYATTKKLGVPANFKSTATTVNSVSLSWSAVSGAESYEIRYDKKGAIGWSYSKKVTGTSVTITGLTPNQAYAFDICAVLGSSKSERSDTIYATTKNLGVPTNFRSTGTTVNTISLSWSAVSGAESYEIRYDKKGTIGWSYSKKVSGTSVTITGLNPNQVYAFDICSVLGSSTSERSDTIYAATQNLEVPANFKSTGTDLTTVSLSWSAVSGAESYEIRYDKKGASGWSYSKKATGTSVTITGLIPNQAYAFDICAVAGDAKSSRSSTIYATTKKLGVPANFKSTATTVNSVSLSWSAVSGAQSYEIRYDKKGAIGWSYTKTATGTSVTITGLTPNQAYAFDICAVLGSSKSDRSDTIYATTKKLAVPANFKSTGTTVNSVSLSWSSVSGAESYEIRYDKKGAIGWSYTKKVSGTSVTITGLNANQAYAFDICAVLGSSKSDRSDTIYATTKKLSVPANFKSTATTVTSVSLSWSSVTGATSYEIRYDKKGAVGWSNSKTVSGTSVTITGLNANQAYAFDICAVAGSAKSDRSSTIYATTKKLAVPTNFKSTKTTVNSVSLSWTAVSGAESYEIRYDKKGAIGWSYSKKVSGTSVTITGLNPNQAYAFDICSVAGSSKSDRSGTIYASTQNLEVPANFRGTSSTSSSITLSWSAVSGATSYEIRYDKKGSLGWRYSKTVTGTSVTITGLNSGTNYAFDIRAIAGSAASGRSSTIYYSTK